MSRFRFPIRMMVLVLGGLAFGVAFSETSTVLESFDGASFPAGVELKEAEGRLVDGANGQGGALEMRCPASGRPMVRLQPQQGEWDWRGYAGIVADVGNAGSEPVDVFASVESMSAEGRRLTGRNHRVIGPGETAPLHLFFANEGTGLFQGLRAIPIYGVVSMHGSRMPTFLLNAAKVTGYQVYLRNPEKAATLVIDNVRLFSPGSPEEQIVAFPWVDRYGQYKHRDWLGKVKEDGDLERKRVEEEKALAAMPELPGRDRFGGWADGPQLEATGWFRTEKVDGKWWLVTPEGRLFLSFGVNCVRMGDTTMTEGRAAWFDELPQQNNFYFTNIGRKYGENYAEAWREVSYKRLRSWGYNTIGNWSAGDVIEKSALPFTGTLGVQGALPRVAGAEGFWSNACEVYAPDFEKIVDEHIAAGVAPYKDNALCIGYFVDNEMTWGSIQAGALASPPEQPSRVVLIEMLKKKYGTIEALNKAWSASATDWDTLRAPAPPNPVSLEDLDAFAYAYAYRYFDTIKTALRKHAPNHLYLGCRFSMEQVPQAIVRACADVVDVVSFNRYVRSIDKDAWSGANDLGKPVIIGEFHYGAADRNMLHPGLVEEPTQAKRAEGFMTYVRGVVDCPALVGCHWFQYFDQPITGRSGDLESFNVGLVQETDLPYAEMVDAARLVLGEAYGRRYGGAARR